MTVEDSPQSTIVRARVAATFQSAYHRESKPLVSQRHATVSCGSAIEEGDGVHRWMRHWQAEAAPVFGTLVRFEERALIATNSVAVMLCCDQLDAAVWRSDQWIHDNPCPERRFDRIGSELIRACVGIQAILLSNLVVDEADKMQAEGVLTELLAVAKRARVALRSLNTI